MNLSIVIPAYNEEKDIRDTIFDVKKEFPKAEIIVVNDASTDNTLTILTRSRVKNLRVLTNEKNMGHGYSVIRGLKEARGYYILYIDADRQIGLGSLHGLPQADVISGWRFNRQDKLFRKFISFSLRLTILLRYGYLIKDANCPLKIYKRDKIQPLLNELPKSLVVPIACLEVLVRKKGLKVVTIPVYHKPYQGVRKGFLQAVNLKMLTFTKRAFVEIWKI